MNECIAKGDKRGGAFGIPFAAARASSAAKLLTERMRLDIGRGRGSVNCCLLMTTGVPLASRNESERESE